MKNKKRGWCYCIKCLYKCRSKQSPESNLCPFCHDVELRHNKVKIVAQVVTRLKRNRGVIPPKRKDWYELYLSSALWRTIRARVLQRDNGRCGGCSRKADVVHHKSYDQVVLDGNDDSRLISLCYNCHEHIEFTVTDGKRRKNSLRVANQKLAERVALLPGR